MVPYNKEIHCTSTNCGYLYFCDRYHPLANPKHGRVYFHRHVASIKVGRWLTTDEHVHHEDENKLNNDPNNLLVLTKEEHTAIHKRSLQEIFCSYCNDIFRPESYRIIYCSTDCSHASSVKNQNITKEILDELIPKMTWVALGKMFNYSDVGIKKRAMSLGCNITRKRRGHSSMVESDFAKV